jgi:thiamine pyrophosphokinase
MKDIVVMCRCVLVTNGSWYNDEWHRLQFQESDFLVGVDGGAAHLYRLGLKPNLVVGDLDSLDNNLIQYFKAAGCEFAVFPREKDFTDTQIALDLIRDRGFREILLLGALGSRVDHLLSTLFSLLPLVTEGWTFKIMDPEQVLILDQGWVGIEGVPGQLVSLLALTPVTGVVTTGLKYPLQDAKLDLFHPYAISNEMLSDRAEVSWDQGVLVVYIGCKLNVNDKHGFG